MAKKRFYPSVRKDSAKDNVNRYNRMVESQFNNDFNLDLTPPFRIQDEQCKEVFETWATRFKDEWFNEIGNVNAGNSLTQYSSFLINRMPYNECAFLASDSIINNAISKYCNEILRKGGKIILDIEDKEYQSDLVEKLEKRLQKLKFFETLKEAISTSLTYGGALIFIDVNSEDLSEPLYLKKEIFTENRINGFRVVPPYLCGASQVETANPLSYDFMKPKQWLISGNSNTVHSSRIIPLVMFEAPVLLKPLFNFLGISLCQFMKNYVSSADIARQSLSDMLLRFKSEIIQSDLIKINPEEAIARAKAINKQKNNNSLILLTKDENYIQSITALSGLDKLIAQLYENVAVSARMPAVKLLGLTPSGFNATGEFDLNSYYDEIMSLQNANIKPIIEQVLKMLCLELGLDLSPSYEFELLTKISKLDEAQIKNLEADFVGKNITNGVITQEQGFDYLKTNELIDNSLDFEESDDDLMEGFENGENKEGFETNQTNYTSKY